jgi:hypothetical protein
MMKCGECVHYKRRTGVDSYGFCKRYPPVFVPLEYDEDVAAIEKYAWPVVELIGEGCGEASRICS